MYFMYEDCIVQVNNAGISGVEVNDTDLFSSAIITNGVSIDLCFVLSE